MSFAAKGEKSVATCPSNSVGAGRHLDCGWSAKTQSVLLVFPSYRRFTGDVLHALATISEKRACGWNER